MDSTQRLWNALAQAIEAKPTQRGRIDSGLRERALLSAAAASPGSFLVELAPADEQLYARSAAELRSLVLASEDPRQLRSKISTLRTRVGSAYSRYLKTLVTWNLEVLNEWPDGAVFLAPAAARRYRETMSLSNPVGEDEITTRGYFVTYNSQTGHFRFHDVEGDEPYEGYVDPTVPVAQRTLKVGPQAIYQVNLQVRTFEATDPAEQQACTLIGFDEVELDEAAKVAVPR